MTQEEYINEIIVSNEVDKAKLSRNDLVLSVLQEAIQSDDFSNSQDDFAEKNCDLFNEEGDLPPQCMKIYQDYAKMIEEKLVKKVEKVVPNFEFDELLPVLKDNKNTDNFMYSDVFEFLNAALDFNEFRALMASYKKGKGLSLDVTTTKLSNM